jgi:hypothetical protein
MASTPVSPKVTASASTAAFVTIVMYLLGLVHFIAVWPPEVKLALLVVVTSGLTWGAGYLQRDPLRKPAPVKKAA